MNLEVTVPIIIALLGAPAAISFSNFFERYKSKISMNKAALLGFLVLAKDELVSRELKEKDLTGTNMKSEKELYDDFISFMNESKFLKYSNEYDDMVFYEIELEKDLNRVSILIALFVIPVIMLQINNVLFPVAFTIGYILVLPLVMCGITLFRKIRKIDRLYKDYVILKQSFGGYDYDNSR